MGYAEHGSPPPRSSPTTTRAPRSGRPTRTARSASSSSPTARPRGSRAPPGRLAQARPARDLHRQAPRADAGRPERGRQAPRDVHRAAAGGRSERRDRARRRRHLPRRARVRADGPEGPLGRQLRRTRRLPAGRRPGRVARLVAGGGAEGAGDRRPHLRDHDGQERRLRPLRRHPLAGLQGRRDRDRRDQRRRRRHPRPGRDLQRPAGRHLLLLDLRRQDRGRREHDAGQRAQAVAEVRRRRVRQRLAPPPLDDEAR